MGRHVDERVPRRPLEPLGQGGEALALGLEGLPLERPVLDPHEVGEGVVGDLLGVGVGDLEAAALPGAYDPGGLRAVAYTEAVQTVVFVIGSLMMAWNVWKTVQGAKPVDIKQQPRVAAAPELRTGLLAHPAE